jgi:hypothetical protein
MMEVRVFKLGRFRLRRSVNGLEMRSSAQSDFETVNNEGVSELLGNGERMTGTEQRFIGITRAQSSSSS